MSDGHDTLTWTHVDPAEGCVQVTVTRNQDGLITISKNGHPVTWGSTEAALLVDEFRKLQEYVAQFYQAEGSANMDEVWGVTYYIDGADEGISVIELFATREAAERFRDHYQGKPDRRYGVTRFGVSS